MQNKFNFGPEDPALPPSSLPFFFSLGGKRRRRREEAGDIPPINRKPFGISDPRRPQRVLRFVLRGLWLVRSFRAHRQTVKKKLCTVKRALFHLWHVIIGFLLPFSLPSFIEGDFPARIFACDFFSPKIGIKRERGEEEEH